MRWGLIALLIVLCCGSVVWAQRSQKPPTFTNLQDTNQLTQLNQTLNDFWNITNGRYTLENLTTDPQGTRKGQKGDLVYDTFGGNDHLCVSTSFPIGTDWTCVNVGTLSTCPGGSDGMVQFNDNGHCGGDASFLFDKNINHVALDGSGTATISSTATLSVVRMPTSGEIILSNDAIDGDVVNLLLSNSQPNVAGSTNETAQLRFGFGSDTDVARIIAGKANDYTSGVNSESFLQFNADDDNTSVNALRVYGTGVGIGVGGNPNVSLEVGFLNGPNGPTTNLLVDNRKDTTVATAAFLQVDGIRARIGGGYSGIGYTLFNSNATSAKMELASDRTVDDHGQIVFGYTADGLSSSNAGGIQLNQSSSGGRPNNANASMRFYFNNQAYLSTATNTLFSFDDNIIKTGLTTEDTLFRVWSAQGIGAHGLASGTTLSNYRYVRFDAPTLNGVAGGATETITNAATVYIDAAPSGSNITFTNGPYAFWVDSGKTQLDGIVQLGQDGASGQLVMYNEEGATDYTVTMIPNNAQTINTIVTLPQVSGILVTYTNSAASHAVCWLPDGKTLGYCSDAVGAGGTCTCH